MWVLSYGIQELLSYCLNVRVSAVSFSLRCRGGSVRICLNQYLLMLLDVVCGRQRSISGSTPQPLSPLCLRQGLSLAWSTLCRLDYLASES